MRWVGAVVAVTLAGALSACTNTIGGAAVLPPGTDPDAEIMLTDDGFGIQIGDPFAPAAIEIFTEPQCPGCADLQFFFGSDLADYVDSGKLTVTYRFLTFLDDDSDGFSHMVSNGMFLAADPDAGVTGEDFQDFVEDVYWDAYPDGDDEWLAEIADEAGLPSQVIKRIDYGEKAVDVEAMNDVNQERLEEISDDPHTPTVYDLNAEEVVDTEDFNWLEDLIGAR